MASIAAQNDPLRSSDLVAPEISYHVPQRLPQQMTSPFSSALVRPHGPPPPVQQPRLPPAVVTPVPPPRIPTQNPPPQPPPPPPTTTPSAAAGRQPPRADRNIDKVVLGDLCFRTWYPSYYGKELLGDPSATAPKPASGGGKDDKAAKKDRDHTPPMLNRLYVCPSCFKYSREIVAWWGHSKVCPLRGKVPGRKIYSHPRGRRTRLVPQGGKTTLGAKRRRGDGGVRYVEETVQDEGEWSIWEVDGEVDRLFCQNLSLFAKLFLDNKSVFFDVGAFNYFLLVYTPPPPPNPHPIPNDPNSAPEPRPQITGLFSKEKLSWDNNNLACILVFPPWQRKGLGALLMGASYEISRREGLLGGPEKPISDLGKKGYMRFWAGEIARWLLSLKVDQGPDHDGGPRETIVDIKECSEATWIAPDDCLFVLRDMGIVEDAGVGPGKPEKTAADEAGEEGEEKQSDQHNGQGSAAEKPEVKLVPRVRVDKAAVRRYVATHRLSLEKVCDPDGFVEGYAMKPESGAGSGEEQTDGGSDE
ncbi:unnamed protein product [Clonostachys rosea f. rosea IK726]|uniref:Uncharacterized protein n=4 Tax=Clonostachys rosea f. rosea IK726 TaxID=1349383 RepID=A0ACA9UVX4_BIOOC|nr:unnamed protein product [Clonostachys rosea f. rosea IK726]CAG9957242.1 unnamed protein product [Clonostachys rosea f. rosea IK726]CAG9957245.1 unnamed protein product [Clonostachys rosea f. rosea IK726]CAG9957276.1 unnamed protein product [Clonostachys rosea f. rosea IK726]